MMKTFLAFYNLNKRNEGHFFCAHSEAHKQEVHRFFFFCFVSGFFCQKTALQEIEIKVVTSEGEL